jgi:glycosyltransferase involved in cell wall biosynthesis
LGVAIESVLKQTFTDLELVIVDDGSTDDTSALVDSYQSLAQSRDITVRYLPLGHSGKSAAINNAMRSVESEWVAFLDSDDEWLPEKLERQFEALRQFPGIEVCFTDFQCMNNPAMDTTIFRFYGQSFSDRYGYVPNTANAILEAPYVSMVTLLCRTELVTRVGSFDPALRFTEDYDFIFRLAIGRDFCFVNEPLVNVDRGTPTRRHTGTAAIFDDLDFRLVSEQYRYEKWLRMGDELPASLRDKITERLRCVHSSWANQHLSRREYNRALRSIAAAASYQITPALIAKWLATRFFPSATRSFTLRHCKFTTEHF